MTDARLILPTLKRKIDVISILTTFFGELEMRGTLTFCPFHHHNHRTPSLHLQEEGKRFRCYSCGVHGDSIDLWRLIYTRRTGKTIAFETAVRSLALFAGIPHEVHDAQTLAGLMRNLAEARREKPDLIRADIVRRVIGLLCPIILAVRRSCLQGAWERAEFLSDEMDTILDAEVSYGIMLDRVAELVRIGRSFLREAEGVAEIDLDFCLSS